MTVPYEEAVATLTAMFEAMDKEVIVMILRENQGHLERTIDILLSMSTDATGPTTDEPSSVPAVENSAPPSEGNISQMEQDEMLARALQNELFLSEVRSDGELNGIIPESVATDDLSLKEVKEKFNQLGESAKLKLRELSTLFFKRDPSTESKYKPLPAVTAAKHGGDVISGHDDDDEEIVAFDARTVRRSPPKAHTLDDEDDEDQSPHLVDRRMLRNRPLAVSGDAK